MHVVTQRRDILDRLHYLSREIARMRSGEPYSAISRHLPYCGQQIGKCQRSAGVFVRVHVLAKELDVSEPSLRHPPRFREHRFRPAAALFAPGVWHHAIGTELVTAFDDGYVSAMLIGT